MTSASVEFYEMHASFHIVQMTPERSKHSLKPQSVSTGNIWLSVCLSSKCNVLTTKLLVCLKIVCISGL